MPFEIEEKLEWGPLATFIPNKKTPIYNWFYYKEGFARELVLKLLDLFQISKDHNVLDPFSGSGTTLLACKEIGINSIGFDAMPISVFASRVKTRNYKIEELKEAAQLIRNRFVKPNNIEVPPIMRRVFSKYALEDVVFFKNKLTELRNNEAISEEAHDFLLLGLINASMKVSWAYKDGSIIKLKKHPTPPLRIMLKRVLKKMIRDLQTDIGGKVQNSEANAKTKINDAKNLDLEDESIDAIITSPPYLNQIDYTKVYSIENWFIENSVKVNSFIGLRENETELKNKIHEVIENQSLPEEAINYFSDMHEVLEEMHRVCKPGANVAIVIGNAYFKTPEQIVDSDMILAKLAEKVGFNVKKISVLNKRAALQHRTIKVGTLRESLIILEKK